MIVKTITPEFTDERGSISNLPLPSEIQTIFDRPTQNVAVITSKAGTTRSNHYHKQSCHWCYLVSGEMSYYEQDIGDSDPPIGRRVEAGQAVFTPPLKKHAMVFHEDSVMISISDMPQTTTEHEGDLVRVDLV
jgi:quercetin dioxygenase-like cupin family protein